MKIFIASDHAGIEAKRLLVAELSAKGYEIFDIGPNAATSVHYPDYAAKLCKEVLGSHESRGILICGSGIGMCMAANRFRGIRAALCRDTVDARLSRLHNNANVLCLGARTTSDLMMKDILHVWIKAEHEEGRHATRCAMLDHLG